MTRRWPSSLANGRVELDDRAKIVGVHDLLLSQPLAFTISLFLDSLS